MQCDHSLAPIRPTHRPLLSQSATSVDKSEPHQSSIQPVTVTFPYACLGSSPTSRTRDYYLQPRNSYDMHVVEVNSM